jgi:hypothetical protein
MMSRLWSRIKGRLPAIGYSLDLLGWKAALSGGRIVSAMLEQGHDALPPTRKALGELNVGDDRGTVLNALAQLHELLYANSKLPADKPGLSRNIRSQLAREDL